MQMVQRLAGYFEGDLDASEKALVQRHLRRCANCRLVAESALETLSNYFKPEVQVPRTGARAERPVVH
jgi:predicted anti-sigma-YlaC factor YlaD